VAGGTAQVTRYTTDPAGLLPLVFSRPRQALADARALLAARPTAHDASLAHQAIGVVERDFGDLPTALTHLRLARRLARQSGSTDRESDVSAALGIALIHAGRTGPGLAMLDTALVGSRGVAAARIRFRRAGALWLLGRHRDALDDLRDAVPVLRRAGDTIWTARALTLRALQHLALGQTGRADRDFAAAEALFAATDQEHERAVAVFNRGVAAYRAGDLPGALARLDEAQRRLGPFGPRILAMTIERCGVLLAAGLPREALDEADRTLRGHDRPRGQATRRAELLLVAARAALAAGEISVANDRASSAARLFATHGSQWWAAHSRLLLLATRFAAGAVAPRLLRDASAVAGRLAALGSTEVTQAHLLAGRVALALNRPADADRHLADAAGSRRHGPALARVTGWLAEALRAEAAGQMRRTLHACRRGLDVLDEHRLTLGASELRAQATAHGLELAACAQRTCLRSARPRDLLTWGERWRATALAVPAFRPPADRGLRTELSAWRELTARVDRARSGSELAPALVRAQDRVERAILARTRRLRAAATTTGEDRPLDVDALLSEVGDGHLIELLAIDGDLHVLLCGAGRVRGFRAGRFAEISAEVEHARAALRRMSLHRPGTPDSLHAIGERLERLLLGEVVGLLGSGAVTVVPPGRLHGVPWAMLPALRDRAFSVVPSARAWLRAHAAVPPGPRHVVLIRGPGLDTGGAEVSALGTAYPHATVLGDGTATAARVLRALDGSWLAHIAAHGIFRADSPLFSALRLDDGPVTVHDFERLRRAPYRLVLPSCDSGQLASVGTDELLGFAAALLPLGTAAIVASVVPVNDEATVGLMLALHDALRAGATMAEALRDARGTRSDTLLDRATGLSFIAIGAG
jgi:tetratricopeptide (TPR) repeat protein